MHRNLPGRSTDLTRKGFLSGALVLGTTLLMPHRALGETVAKALTAAIPVPIDHGAPGGGTFPLPYLLVDRFDPRLETVFVVADGQQFYVRDDVLPSYRALFGDGVNIIGLPGRGTAPALLDAIAGAGPDAGVDWARAYRLLQYRQWIDDIDAVRAALLGRDGKIALFGVSGGGRMVHEYMSVHGVHAARCYTESAVFTPIEAEIGVQHDRFWSEISADDRQKLSDALARRPDQRGQYAQLLQRQNFFVGEDAIGAARHDLIALIAADDKPRLAEAAKAYQVDAIQAMEEGRTGWPIRVREYEFVAPLLAGAGPMPGFRPDIEVSRLIAQPLLDLHAAGGIAAPTVAVDRLNAVQAEALIVAGRNDHTADYRAQIGLAAHYPDHRLLLLDDDHQMHRLKDVPGARAALLRAWLQGFDSPAFAAATQRIDSLRWREG